MSITLPPLSKARYYHDSELGSFKDVEMCDHIPTDCLETSKVLIGRIYSLKFIAMSAWDGNLWRNAYLMDGRDIGIAGPSHCLLCLGL